MSQSKDERIALEASWQAHPKVRALHKAVRDFAEHEGLKFDAHGMTRSAFFVQRWIKVNGPLPPSGLHSI